MNQRGAASGPHGGMDDKDRYGILDAYKGTYYCNGRIENPRGDWTLGWIVEIAQCRFRSGYGIDLQQVD